ncbi:MAG: MerR family DNA-binding transcriptional regulator [Austwickia sp.]|nr:MAG: MerR family DNA-binding transcriptional regulator [Austwickia sp.]
MGEGLLRVGQLAAHLGVSTHALRAWESRYGLFRPLRTDGGYRLYDAADVRRGEEMRERIGQGAPAGEAARLVLRRLPHAAPGAADPVPPAPGRDGDEPDDLVSTGQREQWRAGLLRGCAQLDEPLVRRLLAEASNRLATDDFVDEIVVPILRAVAVGRDDPETLSIAHAHFAGNLVRSALLARQRRALAMDAPRLWLACPGRELHDLGLMAFGLVAAEEGWAVRFFGANTPLGSLAALARKDPPAAVVLSATRPAPLRSAALDVAALAERVPTAIGGPAARRTASLGIPVPTLPGDIVTEARALRRTLGLQDLQDLRA